MNPNSPVVFVHGLVGTLQVPDLLRYFEQGRALAPDLLGYGTMYDVAAAQIGIPAQVAHLRDVVQRTFGEEPVHLVGHSVGGVVAMLFADAFPERVASVVSVEGNFTLNDAFWSSSVARMSQAEADRMLGSLRREPEEWLGRSGIAVTTLLLEAGIRWLAQQPASTIRAMAKSVVRETGSPDYLPKLRSVFGRHPVHLIAGARSREEWDVQEWALCEAASVTIMPETGHLMMLENPAEFAAAVGNVLHRT